MNLKKLFLVLMMSIMLGQAVLASADMHLVFEETDTHHTQSEHELPDHTVGEVDHSGDDCGHCCHAHGCNLLMVSDIQMDVGDMDGDFYSGYQDSFSSAYSDPALRPPIA